MMWVSGWERATKFKVTAGQMMVDYDPLRFLIFQFIFALLIFLLAVAFVLVFVLAYPVL